MEADVWKELTPEAPGLPERWDRLRSAGSSMGALDRLRERHGPSVSRFVSLQAELAARHRGRLEVERLPFLTSKGAEQATAAPVAHHRAQRFADLGGRWLPWDACCGVGSDLLALVDRFPRVLATDRDGPTLRCAAANLAHAHGPPEGRWLAARGDASSPPFAPGARPSVLALFDPDRRPGGAREGRGDRWSPTLEEVLGHAAGLGGACVKLPPALDPDHLTGPAAGLPLALSWVSLDGEMKELAAWSGALADGSPAREAIALRSGGGVARYSAEPEDAPTTPDAGEPAAGAWLVELDGSLWRSGLAGAFAREHRAAPLAAPGPGGFLLADAALAHPMARCWRIEAVCAGDRKRVRAMLRERGVGPLTVKTRFHPESAERLARSLRGEGDRPGLLAVTRTAGRSVAMLLEE